MDPSILSKFIVISKKRGNLIFWHKTTEAISTHMLLVTFYETYSHLQKHFPSTLNTKDFLI